MGPWRGWRGGGCRGRAASAYAALPKRASQAQKTAKLVAVVKAERGKDVAWAKYQRDLGPSNDAFAYSDRYKQHATAHNKYAKGLSVK